MEYDLKYTNRTQEGRKSMTEQGINHNQVEVCGRINSAFEYSHEIFGEGFYTVKLLVNRLSEATDEIPLLISERLVDVTKDYKGMLVRACGQFRSFNKHEENRNHLILSVFVRDLEFIESMDGVRPNQIILDGFICKQPVYRMTPLGREICDILLAVNRSYGKSDYIPCICWGRNARFAGNLEIGSRIQLIGRIQSREYQKRVSENELIRRVAYEVSVNKLEFHEKPIRFGEVRSEHGIPFQKALMAELIGKRKKGDTCFADISLRERGKLSMFNNAIVDDSRVAPTNVANATLARFCDGKKYSDADYVATQTFPQDYDFMDQSAAYVCGMSVPPVMMAQISGAVYEQWLKWL